jgi:hypothetical protein
MKKNEVKVGGVYAAKVSDKLTNVRIDGENPHGGWNATNVNTGKAVRIKSAQRLRFEVLPAGQHATAAEKAQAQKKDTGQKGKAAGAKTSGLDAATKVLAEASEPLNSKQIVERAFEKGYWKSGGKTPHATVYSAMLREIQVKGDQARFRKTARGQFELAR